MSDTSHPINANQTVTPAQQPSKTSSGAAWGAMGLLALALAVVFGGSLYQSSKLNNELTSVKRDLMQSQHQMTDLQGQMGTSTADAKREVNETISKLNEQLENTRKETRTNSYRAQAAAKQQTGKLVTELTAKNTELADQIDQLKKDNTVKSSEVDQTLNRYQR
jgi:hypothetical protein